MGVMAKESVEVVQDASASYTWTLSAEESGKKLLLQWSTTAPFRAQDGKIVVYKGVIFPGDADSDTQASTFDDVKLGEDGWWHTGVDYGVNLYCAWIGGKTGVHYQYIVKLVTD
jgi:hypothetical protein